MTETREPFTLDSFVRTGVPEEPVRPNRLYRALANALLVTNQFQEKALHAELEALGVGSASLAGADVLANQARLRLLIEETLPTVERPVAHARLDHLLLEITR